MASKELLESSPEVIAVCLTILSGGLGYIIRVQREKIASIRNQLSEKKYKLYAEIFSIFFDLYKSEKKIITEKKANTTERLIDVRKDLFIYAPDVIVKKFLEWNAYINNHSNDIKHINLFLELFTLIRKDMGHIKTNVTGHDILRSIMKSDEEYNEMLLLLKSDISN